MSHVERRRTREQSTGKAGGSRAGNGKWGEEKQQEGGGGAGTRKNTSLLRFVFPLLAERSR